MPASSFRSQINSEAPETDKLNVAQDGDTDQEHIENQVKDLRDTKFRYVVLIFACFISFGCYFCYDIPGALQEQFIHDLEISTADFSLFYSLYSWPNIIMCFISGYLLDQVFGLRLGTNIFTSITLLGQLIFVTGTFINKYWLMQIGRFIFGVGGETLTVCQSSFAAKWFKGKELNLVFGLQLSAARLGATVNFLTMVPVYNLLQTDHHRNVGLGFTLLIGSLSCVLSQSCAIVLWFLEGKAGKTFKTTVTTEKDAPRIKILDIKYYPVTYWLILAVCVTYYITVFPFIGLSTVFFQKKYDFSATEASRAVGLIYFISMIGTPIGGFVVDRYHCNIIAVFIGLVCQLATHLIITFTFWTPWIAMSIMGTGFALIACGLWPLVAMEVSDHLVGTAYGIMISAMNTGLAIFSYLSGQIVDTFGYFILEMLFQASICISISFIAILAVAESKEKARKKEIMKAKDQSMMKKATDGDQAQTML